MTQRPDWTDGPTPGASHPTDKWDADVPATAALTRPTRPEAPAGLSPEPFIAFPLWGLRAALRDHQAHCSACSGNQTAECDDDWYAGMLRDKIERLSRG